MDSIVRDHRRIGRVVGAGEMDDVPVVKVQWHDYTREILPRHAVRDCEPEDVRDWVLGELQALATSLDNLDIEDAWTLVPDVALSLRAPDDERSTP